MTAALQEVELDPPQFIKYVVRQQNQQILGPGYISCIYRWLGYRFLFCVLNFALETSTHIYSVKDLNKLTLVCFHTCWKCLNFSP